MDYDLHKEVVVEVDGAPGDVFARLDDQAALGAHMSEGSAMMAGGRMGYDLDAAQGKAIGSVIRMRGEMLGLKLYVEEVVTAREPPRLKTWETRGRQRMIVMDAYRMGFEVAPAPSSGSRLRMFIDYNLPRGLWGWLVSGVAASYARWCIERMAKDAARAFAANKSVGRAVAND